MSSTLLAALRRLECQTRRDHYVGERICPSHAQYPRDYYSPAALAWRNPRWLDWSGR